MLTVVSNFLHLDDTDVTANLFKRATGSRGRGRPTTAVSPYTHSTHSFYSQSHSIQCEWTTVRVEEAKEECYAALDAIYKPQIITFVYLHARQMPE